MARSADGKRYLTPRGRTLKVITKSLIFLYRLTGGAVGGRLRGLPGILLTTTGRRSGQPRTVHLPYFADGGDLIVVASFAGGPRNPAWYGNIVANPAVTVQERRRVYGARAQPLEGAERDEVWRMVVQRGPWYQDYQNGVERQIPLVRITPA